MSAIDVALAGWLVLAAAWLAAMPAGDPARRWHYSLSLTPLPLLIALAFAPLPPELARAFGVAAAAGGVVIIVLTAAWVVGTRLRNHGVMDIAYNSAAFMAALATWILADASGSVAKSALLAGVFIWGARLFAHTMRTNRREEMQPYAALRKRHGAKWWWWSWFQVYLLQGVIVWIWLLPVVFAMTRPNGAFTALDAAGVAVWVTGFFFQAVADHQLKKFKEAPANQGKVMRSGLWAYSRHPNYFGESLMWWSYFLLALGHPWGWLSVVGPLYNTWFMSVGSAAAGNERHQLRKKPEYADYVNDVPMFVPWFRTRRPSDGRTTA